MCLFRNAEQNKNMQAYFVLRSTCTTFNPKLNVGGVSEVKICKHILYFAQLALHLSSKCLTL